MEELRYPGNARRRLAPVRRLVLLLALLVPAPATASPRDEASALAAATRAAIHDVNALRTPFHASVVADRRRRGCGVRFPGRVSDDHHALDRLRTLHAVDDPLRPALGAFAARLAAVAPRDPVLHRGAEAWLRALAPLPPQPTCAALRRWAHGGFRREARPFDLRAAERADSDQNAAIEPTFRAAQRLRHLGVPPRVATRFDSGKLRADLDSAVPPGPLRSVLAGHQQTAPRILALTFFKGAEPFARFVVHEGAGGVNIALEVREPPPYDASGELIVMPAIAETGCVELRLARSLGHRRVVNEVTHRRVREERPPILPCRRLPRGTFG
jgi:hypothetical protein